MAHIISNKTIRMFTLVKNDHEAVLHWCAEHIKGNWQEFDLHDEHGNFVILIENDTDARLFEAKWSM